MSQYITPWRFASEVNEDYRRWSVAWDGKTGVAVITRLFFLEPGFQLIFSCRLQRLIFGIPFVGKPMRRVIWYLTTIYFGADIDPQAQLAGGIFIPHPTGIVVGGQCSIESGVSILSNVTLGRSTAGGAGPTIGRDVLIGSGAKIVGPIRVGNYASIGANSVVLKDVPDGYTAVGVPAKNLPPRARR